LIVVILIFGSRIITLYTDWLWFQEVGFQSVFTTLLLTKLALGVGVGLLALAVIYSSWALAIWATRDQHIVLATGKNEYTQYPLSSRQLRRIAFLPALVIAAFIGLLASTEWQTLMQYVHRTPVADRDPLFGRSVSFYLFQLPLWEYVQGLGVGLMILCLIGSAIIYLLKGAMSFSLRGLTFTRAAKVHLSLLGAVLFLFFAFGDYLDRLNLVYSPRGVVAGASYTDIHAELPLIWMLVGVGLLGVVLLISNLLTTSNRPVFLAVGLYVIIILAKWVYPESFQRVVVVPNEVEKETPYINYNIAATRKAFGLDDVQQRPLSGESALTAEDVQRNAATINNVRLWDREPLLDTFSQLQEIRLYYEFGSVDVDRYMINGEYRQTMLSPRELSSDALPNRSWLNERLVYTHGYGLTLAPVNRVTAEGLPVLFIKDIPPVSTVNLKIQRPEIYFGEFSNEYVFVHTRQKEFNYPAGENNVYTDYAGEGGVKVDSFFRKLMYAFRFGSMDVLLSENITTESRVLLYRTIQERVARIAPFLSFDNDHYMIVSSKGRLYWILDAYTITDRFPYAEPIKDAGRYTGINYIRNAVKVVIDAYSGRLWFYLADPSDVLIQTYSKIFPTLFLPLDQMPADLRAHIRYPSDLFVIQTRMYSTYHMKNPQVFYNREDQWEIPLYTSEGKDHEMEPYHTIMKLPGGQREEFILMRPFTPKQKDNLAAWMVARTDGEQYGKLIVYEFPKQTLIYGPRQVSARINQDPEISRQLSLWNQRGSQVILGRLIVIPIEESLIYVQPLYLRAETGKIPELKRVIVAYQNQIAMEETLEQSLNRIFKGASLPEAQMPAAQPARAPQPTALPVESLAAEAQQHYQRAIEAQRAGDWAKYGEEIKLLGDVLKQMQSSGQVKPR
jgi:hypothetical protein